MTLMKKEVIRKPCKILGVADVDVGESLEKFVDLLPGFPMFLKKLISLFVLALKPSMNWRQQFADAAIIDYSLIAGYAN